MPRRRKHKKNDSISQDPCDGKAEENYLIRKSDTMGRYLVASRDLPEGSVIISEEALVVGPAQDSLPVCLGCYSPITNLSTAYRCETCLWSLCSNKCQGIYTRLGHSIEECSMLKTCKVDSSQLAHDQLYNAIVPLRCLLLRQHSPDRWRTLMTMEAHNSIRRKIPSIWNYNQNSVVDRIRQDWEISLFSEEDIHSVCGILEVNAFAVGNDSLNIRGLYQTAFLIAHSCVPNTSHTDDDKYHITIFSSVPVKKGEMIALSYTNSLQGTRKRREHLKQCKFFECKCHRCSDPTELGTFLSAVKCSKCSSGHLLSMDPLTPEADWLCDDKKCQTSLCASDIDNIINRIESETKVLDYNNIEKLEKNILLCGKMLHTNHYLILRMKYTLSQLYGKSTGFIIHQMSEAMLERKQQICEEILQVFDVLEPGLTHVRGLTLYELHAPIMILTIQRFEMHKISKMDLYRKLKKVSCCLKECSQILKFDNRTSQEGCIRAAAEDALAQLKSWEPVVGKL